MSSEIKMPGQNNAIRPKNVFSLVPVCDPNYFMSLEKKNKKQNIFDLEFV